MPARHDDPSGWHLTAFAAITAAEVVLAYTGPSNFTRDLLLIAAVLAVVGSIAHLSDHSKAHRYLWAISLLIGASVTLYRSSEWLLFHMRDSLIGATVAGFLIALVLAINGRGLVRLPD